MEKINIFLFIFVLFIGSISTSRVNVSIPYIQGVNTYPELELAIVAATQNGTYLLNISDPFNPTLFMTLPYPTGIVQQVITPYIYGDRIFTANSNRFHIWDISNISNPIMKGNVASQTYTNTLQVDGNILYLNAGDGGFKVYNVTNIASPALLFTQVGRCYDVALHPKIKGIVFASIGNNVTVFDCSNLPSNCTVVSSFSSNGTGAFLKSYENLLVAHTQDFYSGLRIFNITNPSNVVLLSGPFGFGSWNQKGIDIKLVNGVLLLAATAKEGVVNSYDITNPSNPIFIRYYLPMQTSVMWGVSIYGEALFFAAYNLDRLIIESINTTVSQVTTGMVTTGSSQSTTGIAQSSTTGQSQVTTSSNQQTTTGDNATTSEENSFGIQLNIISSIILSAIAIILVQ